MFWSYHDLLQRKLQKYGIWIAVAVVTYYLESERKTGDYKWEIQAIVLSRYRGNHHVTVHRWELLIRGIQTCGSNNLQ
jgi:hypothetical protein